MILNDSVAQKMAALLLQIKAVKLSPAKPFTWASGWKSPIYCDNRLTLSFPEIRTFIKEQLSEIIKQKFSETELIAGVATAGIAHGALAADFLETPFCYVRSSPKDHGLENRIEGLALPGQKVCVVEDLISTGASSLSAVNALRSNGCSVSGMAAIFTYGFEIAEKSFNEAHCPFYTLTDYETLLHEAVEANYIQQAEITSLQQWRKAPDQWMK